MSDKTWQIVGVYIHESDKLLSFNCILRIIRSSLPRGCKISHEVKERILEVSSELIGFITNHSIEEYMIKSKRKTLLPNDIINSLNDLDLNIFIPPLNAYLNIKQKEKQQQQQENKENENNDNKDDNDDNDMDMDMDDIQN